MKLVLVRIVVVVIVSIGRPAWAERQPPVPSLALADVVRLAIERRDEIAAARARVRAAEARPAIVSALPDPMLSPSVDHLPFMMGGADVSITIEQQLPLSRVRGHRRLAAVADVERLRADAARIGLDVAFEAASAFVMLEERRRMQVLAGEQLTFARDVVSAASARYASATAPQSDVLRAEVEVARLDAMLRAAAGEVRAAEAMFNASLGWDPERPVPPLAPVSTLESPPPWPAIRSLLATRPELTAGRAEINRAEAEVLVMRDMFRPMLTVRTGMASTMAEGKGWMAMAGVSLPIWRARLKAGVAEAEAMRAMAEADVRAMTRMVEGQAAAAASQVHAARERYRALADNVIPRARMTIEPAIAGYSTGQLPLVSVIEAVQSLWLVQGELIAAEIELRLAWVQLGRAIGSYEGITP